MEKRNTLNDPHLPKLIEWHIFICNNFWDWWCLDFCINIWNHTLWSIIGMKQSKKASKNSDEDGSKVRERKKKSQSSIIIRMKQSKREGQILMMEYELWFEKLMQKSKHNQSQKFLQIIIINCGNIFSLTYLYL